jgi:hypothetical protein
LPTRLIEVTLPDHSTNVRLYETHGETGQYACLSHRWIEGHTITTVLSNIDDRKKEIQWEALPKTFQDAITIVRKLGLRYIWIDSLCIIQGSDSDDWIKEAPKMASTYQQAYITISASYAVNKENGCFSTASPLDIGQRLDVTSISGRFEPYTVYWRLPISHNAFPLQHRGWVLQEALLSPRLLHFGDTELVWECTENTTCECGMIDPSIILPDPSAYSFYSGVFGRKTTHYQALSPLAGLEKLKNRWRDIVHEYTRKGLTFQEDIFPALAGLAKQMQSIRKCEYYAGLWEDSLATDLLWVASDEFLETISDSPRPAKWRAPSWSWASTTSPVTYAGLGHLFTDTTGSCMDLTKSIFVDVKNVECVPEPDDPTMRLKSARLCLSGNLLESPLATSEDGHSLQAVPPESGQTFFPDYDFSLEGPFQITKCTPLKSLLVAAKEFKKDHSDRTYFSLILRCIDAKGQLYERIGVLQHTYLPRAVRVQDRSQITIL